ncbi:MAG: DUF559 domain-containing protein [Proteobacteria bacterium]|nr:DUF559 domain-containing protein [Pseudomonadota bacterium]
MARELDRRIPVARRLRRETTYQERLVWNAIRQFDIDGFHPRRQAPIGPFIVDFACHGLKVVIEIDGDHHAYGEQLERDNARDAYLAAHGYRVVRVTNQHIAESKDGAVEMIFATCLDRSTSRHPTPAPSPSQAHGGKDATLAGGSMAGSTRENLRGS